MRSLTVPADAGPLLVQRSPFIFAKDAVMCRGRFLPATEVSMWPRLPQNVCQGGMTDLQPAAAAAGLLFEGQTRGMREHAAAEA